MSYERCVVCNIPLVDGDKALWCKMRNCPETDQRNPTDKQVEDFKIGEKDARKLG